MNELTIYAKIEEMPREIERLLEENERLQEELDKTRLSELDKEYRISKAIEYIEKDMKKYGGDIYITCKDILEILDKGE